jgi:hypothetical protein
MINTNKEAGESSFISTFSLLKESIIQSIEKRSLSASLIQKVAIGAFATITMGFLSYQSIKYFYSTFQNREFEKILQSWLREQAGSL